MPNAAFFSRFGVFVRENFLDAETCARLRQEASAARSEQAKVQPHPGEYKVDLTGRKVRQAMVSAETTAFLRQRLNDIRPEMNEFFKVTLAECEDPETVIYGLGDFYVLHVDGDDELPRHCCAIIYLNEQTPKGDDAGFEGGELVLYGIFGDQRSKDLGFPLEPSTGLFVSFSSRLLHEVKPITRGERFAVVTCYS